jgi:hypothetical protein
MLARTVRLHGLLSASEARLLGIVTVTILALIFLSTVVDTPQWLRVVALFIHLISLVVGFGAVLAVDWYGLLSLSRRVTIGDVLLTAERMTPLIWIGLAGLTASGVFAQARPEFLARRVQALLCGWCRDRWSACPVDQPCCGTSNAGSRTVADTPWHGARRRLTDVLVDGCHHWIPDQSGGTLTALRSDRLGP